MLLTSTAKVSKYLKNLDVRKSTGTDEIGARLLKLASPFIAESMTFICNLSIRTGSYPENGRRLKLNHYIKEDQQMTSIISGLFQISQSSLSFSKNMCMNLS